MSLETLIKDAEHHMTRTAREGEIPSRDLRRELSDNLWPFMVEVLQALKARTEAYDEAFDELLARESSFIQSELGGRILGCFQMSQEICAEFVKVIEAGEPVSEEKATELKSYLKGYIEAMRPLAEEVQSVIYDPEEGGDDDQEGDGDDEGGEGDDAGGEEEAGGEQGAAHPLGGGDSGLDFSSLKPVTDQGDDDDDGDDDEDNEDDEIEGEGA